MAGIPAITTQLQRTASAADIFSSNVLTSQFASTTAPTSMMSSSISRITDTMSPQNSSLLLNSLSSVDQSNPLYHHNFLVQDQRTLQLAVELSLAGLNDATAVTATSSVQTPVSNADIHSRAAHAINYQHQLLHRHVMNQEDLCSLKAMSSAVSTATNGNIEHIGSCGNGAVTSTNILSSNGSNNITLNDFFTANSMLTSAIDDRSKKSQNMTECVPVPSSEHVAEIVGRQGCKIKALRAKTNTYIKTPVRGEEPVFVVTGRKEDVTKAKREILSAAEHFSLIRATRKPSAGNSLSVVPSNENNVNSFVANAFVKIPSKPSMPGQVTIQVRVPYRVVGLVVGPKGTTIKHIQHQTQTYIVTPSREKEPIFEVTGLPNNVQSARQQIEAHIALRTGSLDPIGINSSNSAVVHSGPLNDVSSDHSLSALSKILSDPTIDADILLSLCKDNSMSSSPGYEVEACEERTKKTSGEGLEAQGRDRKNGFDIISLENDFFEKQTNFLHPDTIQFQYFNTSNHALDYTNDLEGKINIKTSSGQRSYFLADLDSALNVQKQKEQLYPSFQPTFTLNHKLQNSSVPSMKRNKFFRSDSTASSYMQLNFATNTTSEGSPGIQNASIDTQNSNSNRITRSCSSASSTASSRSANNSGSCSSSRPELINIWKHFGESLDLDEGFGDLPNIWTLPTSLSTLKSSNSSPSTSISPTDSYSCEIPTHTHSYKVALNRLINESHHECKINKSLLEKKHIKKDDVMRTILYDSATPRLECLLLPLLRNLCAAGNVELF